MIVPALAFDKFAVLLRAHIVSKIDEKFEVAIGDPATMNTDNFIAIYRLTRSFSGYLPLCPNVLNYDKNDKLDFVIDFGVDVTDLKSNHETYNTGAIETRLGELERDLIGYIAEFANICALLS